jgi:hypothetical protein
MFFTRAASSLGRTRLSVASRGASATREVFLARHASNRARSFYNTDISGLTEEQEEVRVSVCPEQQQHLSKFPYDQ